MKKIYYLSAAICLAMATNANAQSMSEDFEGWTVGSYMGVNSADWTTWSGATGGAEDVQVTNVQAASGTKSIYFMSTSPSGGPQDVVVPFGGEHNTGQFSFDANFYVESNQGAYFNFQGNNTIGQLWTFNCQMHNNGTITFDDGTAVWATDTYPQGQWFNIAVNIDLNTNSWDVLMDGISIGVFQATNNQVASIDIFPVNNANGGNNQSSFYVDDFNYTHTSFTLPAVNAAPSFITDVNGVATSDKYPTVTVRNLGTSTITSFDLEIDYNGTQIVENVTGLSIPSMGTTDVTFTNAITLISGPNAVTATVSNVNGNGQDDNANDDSKSIIVDPIVPAPGKVVVGEEATGTWCQWCPRGAVFMDYMEDTYQGFWAGSAVHNGDPMVNTDYDAGIGGLIGGYPSALVDRQPEVDPSVMENDFFQRVVIPPNGLMTNGATYNSTTGQLDISVTTEFVNTLSGNWKVAVVVTEDGVTGSGAGWAQANAYAGGASGPMGGYESLPNPVPASIMVYDHVARDIQPSFGGEPNAFPQMNAGQIYANNYTVMIDPGWNIDSLHIISMLISPSGDIDNAGYTTLAEAETNGFQEEGFVGIDEPYDAETNVDVYPNPAVDNTSIYLHGLHNAEVIVQIFDVNGKLVYTENYGELNGEAILPINTEAFEAGVYTIQTFVGDVRKVDKLIVK